MPGVKLTPTAARRLARGVEKIETFNPGAARTTRNRYPRRGTSGSPIRRGWLVDDLPAESVAENCIVLADWNKTTNTYDTHDGELLADSARIGGINFSHSPRRGTTTLPILVYGVLQKITIDDVEQDALEIFWADLASLSGHQTVTPDGVSQMPRHVSGSDAYGVDGGPCDTCEPAP